MREGSQCLFAENAAPRDPTPNQAEDDGWRLFRRVGGVYKQQTLKDGYGSGGKTGRAVNKVLATDQI